MSRRNSAREKPVTPVVEAIGQIHFEGNIVPHSWYRNVLADTGRPDLIGITILADVVYWYRPVVVKDEAAGAVREVRRKFSGDKLSRSYNAFATQYGLGRSQVKRAIDRLVSRGLLTTEFRTVTLENGAILHNALFLELVPTAIARISNPVTAVNKTHASVRGKPSQTCEDYPDNAERTYTENTPESPKESRKETKSRAGARAAGPSPVGTPPTAVSSTRGSNSCERVPAQDTPGALDTPLPPDIFDVFQREGPRQPEETEDVFTPEEYRLMKEGGFDLERIAQIRKKREDEPCLPSRGSA